MRKQKQTRKFKAMVAAIQQELKLKQKYEDVYANWEMPLRTRKAKLQQLEKLIFGADLRSRTAIQAVLQ